MFYQLLTSFLRVYLFGTSLTSRYHGVCFAHADAFFKQLLFTVSVVPLNKIATGSNYRMLSIYQKKFSTAFLKFTIQSTSIISAPERYQMQYFAYIAAYMQFNFIFSLCSSLNNFCSNGKYKFFLYSTYQ